jgi:hypothetical protein
MPDDQPIYSCYNEDVVKSLIVKTFSFYDDIISDWLVNSGAVLKLKISGLNPVGYKLDPKTGVVTELNNAIVTIRGNAGDNVDYGFYIQSVIPEE